MRDEPEWITTPHIRPDHRGPVERPWTPFADPAVAPPILETLQNVAARQPDRVAVEDAAGGITYRQLLDAARRMARRIEQAQPAAAPVAILLPSSPAYAVALFACLLARRPAVLLDEHYPAARNASIAAGTGVTLVLADLPPGWPGVRALAIDSNGGADALDEPEGAAGGGVDGAPLFMASADLDAPAFLLCTSGSAGLPKAIAHSQRTMLHWARTTHEALHVAPEDRVLSLSSLASLGGFTGLLNFCLAGAAVQMLELKTSGLAGLLATLQSRPVTILRAVPSTLRGLAGLPDARRAFAGLRAVQTYGEPLLKADLVALLEVLPPGCKLRSTYGSTEGSGLSWFADATDDHDALRVASGTLMPDTVAAIVDDGRSCARGEAGELWIRSRYNALGEWRDGRLVSGALQPHSSGDGTRVFRTGDIARCNSEGVFVVLGRADRMVKVNGQRLEPAEIETALRRIEAVRHAEVVVHGEAARAKLTAFVVASGAAAPDLVARMRDELKATLPSFMLPTRIVLVPSIPMLPGGKVDRLALLALAGTATAAHP